MQRSPSPLGSPRGAARLLTAVAGAVGLVGLCLAAAPAHAQGQSRSPSPSSGQAQTQGRIHPTDDGAPDFTVLARPRAKAPRSKGTTKTLVVQLTWDGAPATDNRGFLNQNDLVNTSAWFRTVSHNKYGVSGTVTPPLHVGRLGCGNNRAMLSRYTRAATKAAKHAGYKPKHWKRLVISLPCPPAKDAGLGETPGNVVWLFAASAPVPRISPPTPAGAATRTQTGGASSTWWAFADWRFTWSDGRWETQTFGDEYTDPVHVPTHEMSHNLGLQHAHLLQCSKGGVPTSFGGQCKSIEYGDAYDAMGNGFVAGGLNAASLHRLHWLPGKIKHVKRKATVTLSPLEGAGGTQAISVKGKHGRTYWVELRTRSGVDAPFDPAQTGVLVHYTKPHSTATWLVDALPGSSRAWNLPSHVVGLSDREQAQLLPGHTLKTPEGISITTLSQSDGSAVVTVTAKHAKKHHHKKHHAKHKKHHKKKHHKKHKKH